MRLLFLTHVQNSMDGEIERIKWRKLSTEAMVAWEDADVESSHSDPGDDFAGSS